MSNKLPPKKQRQLYHKIAILSDILIDTIDELGQDANIVGKSFKNSLEISKSHCESIVKAAFDVSPETGEYLNNISKKIDTVLRQNYKEITKDE